MTDRIDLWTDAEGGADSQCSACGAAPGAQCSDREGTEYASRVHCARVEGAAAEQAIEHVNEVVRLLFRLFPELNDDDAEERIPPEARRICMELGEVEGFLGSLVRDRSRP